MNAPDDVYSFHASLGLFEEPNRLNRLHTCQDMNDLRTLIIDNHNQIRGKDEDPLFTDNTLPGISSAVEALGGPAVVMDFLNPNGLYQRLVQAACELNDHFPFGTIPTLSRKSGNASVHFSARQVVCILANAFLGNLSRIPLAEPKHRPTRTIPHYGSLSWHLVFQSSTITATERTKGLLLYFQQALEEDSSNEHRLCTWIGFRRIALPNSFSLTKAIAQTQHLAPVTFVSGGVETAMADAMVDFANEDLHIGAVWPSATQEEILFSIHPECFTGLLFCETMDAHEAITINGVRAYCETRGFRDTFRVDGPSPHSLSQLRTILAMDASVVDFDTGILDQSSGPYRDRDLIKAIAGFSTMAGKLIATGHWGCGAFGGDVYCKFLVQLIAASICNASLVYCLVGHGSEEVMSDLTLIYTGVERREISVSEIYRVISDYHGPESPASFREYVLKKLSGNL